MKRSNNAASRAIKPAILTPIDHNDLCATIILVHAVWRSLQDERSRARLTALRILFAGQVYMLYGTGSFTPAELVRAAGMRKLNVAIHLRRSLECGHLIRVRRGVYQLSSAGYHLLSRFAMTIIRKRQAQEAGFQWH